MLTVDARGMVEGSDRTICGRARRTHCDAARRGVAVTEYEGVAMHWALVRCRRPSKLILARPSLVALLMADVGDVSGDVHHCSFRIAHTARATRESANC